MMHIIRPGSLVMPYFERASTGTYVGSDGLLKTAAINERRPNYVAGVQDGWIYEPAAATNLLLQSKADTSTGWDKGANITRVGNSTAPDGTNTATTYQSASTSSGCSVGQLQARAASTTYTVSVWARLVSGSVPTVGSLIQAYYDSDSNGATQETASLAFAGSGLTSTWKRYSLTFNNLASIASAGVYFCVNYTVGVQIAIWGAQLEVGSAMSSYIPTAAATATRAAEINVGTGKDVVSSTATETTSLWNPATSYTVGARVLRPTTQRIYSNVTAGVSSELPETPASTRWVDIGPSNKMAMFDAEVGSITTATDTLTVVLQPGSVSGLAAQELSNANTVSVSMKDAPGGTTVLTKTVDLEFSQVLDVYDWLFLPYEARSDFQLIGLPEFAACELTVSIVGSGAVGCGLLAAGAAQEVGSTEVGAKIGRINYSIKSVNSFGRVTVTKRGSARTLDLLVRVERNALNRLTRFLDQIKDEPCIFIGDEGDGLEALIAYGIYKDWSMVVDLPDYCLLNIFVEGFI